MESNSVCNRRSNFQNRTSAKWESNLLITSMIKDRIGRHKVLLPINHNRYNFRKHQIRLGQILYKNSSIFEVSLFFSYKWLSQWLLLSILRLMDLAERTKYHWLLYESDYRCPIVINCPITTV